MANKKTSPRHGFITGGFLSISATCSIVLPNVDGNPARCTSSPLYFRRMQQDMILHPQKWKYNVDKYIGGLRGGARLPPPPPPPPPPRPEIFSISCSFLEHLAISE